MEIFFTANGTQTLWTRTIDNTNAAPGQKTNETISFPATTSTGRLTIMLNAKSGRVTQGGLFAITPTQVVFGLDNIRVK